MRASLIRRASWAIAATSVVVGAAVWMMPARDTVEPLAPGVADTISVARSTVAESIPEDVVMANVFAASRTAPGTRYTPGEVPGETTNGAMMSFDSLPGFADEAMDVPKLLGTVISPEGPRALLLLDPASSSRLYAEGEEDAGYRIVSIAPRVVVLRHAGGRVTLRLDPKEDRP